MKNKKPLFISLISLDVAITIFLFVISIIMLANASKTNAEKEAMGGLIGFLMTHTLVYGLAFVVPLFVLLAVNIVGLVIYVKRTTKKEPVKVDDLTDEQKEALRQELLKDLQGGNKEK
jgi:uncharacterized protein YpmS